MSFQPSAPRKRRRWAALLVIVLLATGAFASTALAAPTFTFTVDDQGANDEPGQKDLTAQSSAVDGGNFYTAWKWDDIAWNGNNTGDGCSLFDTDSDGLVNYAVCASVQGKNPVTLRGVALYSCSDLRNDRCTQPTLLFIAIATAGTYCAVTDKATGSFDAQDTLIVCNITALAAAANPPVTTLTGGTLLNTCSYPSQEPNSDPSDCVLTPTAGTLHVVKVVVNDNGGTKTASDFSFSVNGGTATAFEADGQNDLTVSAGSYTVTEPAVSGYTTTYSNCTSVVIANGGSATCTITNDDQAATLIVKKVVVNDNGGTKTAVDFSFSVNGGTATAFEADGQNDLTVDAGTYTVTEPAVSGYTTTYDNCTSVVIANGGSATCTITNDDQAATLIVKKVVVNDNGGTKTASDFSFSVNGGTATAFEADGQNDLTVDAGTYTVTEPAVSGYTTTYDNCTSVVIANGGSATCTITNNDNITEPSIATTMQWTLNDASALTGFLSGGGVSTVTFTLYKDTATETSCEPSTQVFTETVNVDDTDGTAATTTGYTTTEAGTYRWIASFSGNTFNSATASECTSEVTTLP